MAAYNLGVLNDKEFEELCKDLLEKELSISFQIFKTGRDKGIDLRYAKTKENEIIVQAKQFVRSSYSNLKTSIIEEKKKMDRLSSKPERYILMTAFDLSVGQIDEIVLQLKPYLQTSHDVYAGARIMNLIAKYPEIEKKYYKLWLTSTSILNEILHNGVNGRSEFVKEKILRKASFYVPTKNYDFAVKKLMEHHFLIISGEPGIGKTTISYLLICELLAKGFQLIYVDDQLKDAEDLLSPSPEAKQVVFFDDFFGANLSEILNPRNTEAKIVSFIERIQASTNKYLVMTTRTTILKQAQYRFDKFKRSGFADLSKYELEITSYSKLDKAKILYNHLFHSGMAMEQYDVFFKSNNYLKIISHKNYFPRLIEFITAANRLKIVPVEQTEFFIFNSLDNPREIWHFAYEQQLNEEERFLLMTLFSLGGYNVASEELEKAFEGRYAYEISENGYQMKTDAYQQSLVKLLDGFIKSEKRLDNGRLSFSFLNPSIGDFVIHFLRERFSEVKRILFSAVYFKQITTYFSPESDSGVVLTSEQLLQFFPRFNKKLENMLDACIDSMAGQVSILFIYLRYFREHVNEERLLEIVSDTDLFLANVSFKELYYVLNNLDTYTTTQEYITAHWPNFFTRAIEVAADSYQISTVLDVLNYYEVYEEDWCQHSVFMSTIKETVNGLYTTNDVDLSSHEENLIYSYFEGYSDRALEIVEEKIADDYANFLNDCSLSNYFEPFYQDTYFDAPGLLDSYMENVSQPDEYEPEDRLPGFSNVVDEATAIDRLFER